MFNNINDISSGRVCGWEILLRTATINSIFFGKGFLTDQIYLKPVSKTASNSLINIFYNGGIISIFIFVVTIMIFLIKYFKIKNFLHKNTYVSWSHYLTVYFLMRSLLEDTMAFVSVDFLLLGICMIFIKENFIKDRKNSA